MLHHTLVRPRSRRLASAYSLGFPRRYHRPSPTPLSISAFSLRPVHGINSTPSASVLSETFQSRPYTLHTPHDNHTRYPGSSPAPSGIRKGTWHWHRYLVIFDNVTISSRTELNVEGISMTRLCTGLLCPSYVRLQLRSPILFSVYAQLCPIFPTISVPRPPDRLY